MKNRIREIMLNGFILFASIFVSILIVEILIRLFSPQPVNIKGTRFSNILLYENMPGAKFDIKSPEFETKVIYNNEGFRDNDFELEKKSYRIAVIGDSFVDALQVPFDAMFPNKLESLLNQGKGPVEVMNFGVGGYGTDQELIMLKNKVLKYKPDVVLLMYCHNDIRDVFTNKLIKLRNGNLHFRVHNPNLARKKLKAFIRNLHTYYFIKKRILQLPVIARTLDKIKIVAFELGGEEFMSKYSPRIAKKARSLRDRKGVSVEIQAFMDTSTNEIRDLWDFEFRLLKEFKDITHINNARFGMVIITKHYQLDDSALNRYLSKYRINKKQFIVNKPNKNLVDFCESENIPILDLYPIFKKYSDDGKVLHFRKDGHWNKLGHELATGEILKFLMKYDLVDGREG